jgi:hypothetical protein
LKARDRNWGRRIKQKLKIEVVNRDWLVEDDFAKTAPNMSTIFEEGVMTETRSLKSSQEKSAAATSTPPGLKRGLESSNNFQKQEGCCCNCSNCLQELFVTTESNFVKIR